jgi:hypothetical protein
MRPGTADDICHCVSTARVFVDVGTFLKTSIIRCMREA